MPTGIISSVASVGGLSIQTITTRTAVGQIGHEVSLPAADAGSLTTRTNDTDGELTMDSGEHGISSSDKIDIYWDGGVAYEATVGTVSGTAVPFTGAHGDVLPTQDTDVAADVLVPLDTDFDGDLLEMIAMASTKRGHYLFDDSGTAELAAGELTANEPWTWVADTGVSNPLTGNPVDDLYVSNGDATAAATLKIGLIYNSDE